MVSIYSKTNIVINKINLKKKSFKLIIIESAECGQINYRLKLYSKLSSC